MEIKSSKITSEGIRITCEEGNKVIGWGFLYVIKNDRHEEPYAFLENLYVEPEHRSKGIGSKILEAMIAKAKEMGCYKVIGNSREQNTKAHDFYQRFGFKKHGYEFRMGLKESAIKQED